ncbi:MAG: 3-hydroxybutyryl-CoA dehydrogenase [Alphaproteobacteria bacterium]|nr:3-hydroxybutyryl-CoA dehydrogenase [Alphaproteobacteria bacterium]
MARKEPRDVRRVTCIGAGPIGGGWSAHFLAHGYQVTTYLHDAAEEEALRQFVDTAWPSLESLGLADGASPNALRCTSDLAAAVANAEFVQESAPENLALKQSLYVELGTLVPDDVVIASSTSGLTMTDIQARCPSPERTVVAHPFNPPYLLPLVEIVGGARTDPAAVVWLAEFYRLSGKAPLVMDTEIPGFIATRLQEALWREALHMVANGEATVEQIDLAITTGPGPRWAVMGPCMAFHVAAGEGGMAATLDHFGPALKLPWTRLEAPELTSDLRERMVAGCLREAAGRDFTRLAGERDAALVAVARALKDD